MLRYFVLFFLASLALLALPHTSSAQSYYSSYYYTTGYYTFTPQAPRAERDGRIDPHLIKAAHIAKARALSHTTYRCWRSVKDALLEAGAVRERPATNYACDAGNELTSRFGFVRLQIHDPYHAPLGSVLVYSGGGAGHVELRTEDGFASDYRSHWRCKYRLTGVYAKLG